MRKTEIVEIVLAVALLVASAIDIIQGNRS